MDIIYRQIYIPKELSGQRGRVIFKASHRGYKAQLFWHVDNEFIRQTDVFHDVTLDLEAGWHRLVLVDGLGFRVVE
jgi:penicillin-binding protein 1C